MFNPAILQAAIMLFLNCTTKNCFQANNSLSGKNLLGLIQNCRKLNNITNSALEKQEKSFSQLFLSAVKLQYKSFFTRKRCCICTTYKTAVVYQYKCMCEFRMMQCILQKSCTRESANPEI